MIPGLALGRRYSQVFLQNCRKTQKIKALLWFPPSVCKSSVNVFMPIRVLPLQATEMDSC